MGNDNPNQPAWLKGVAQPPSIAEQPLTEAPRSMKDYAAWYAWARAHEADPVRCHLAAQAAVSAVQQGRDRNAAAQEAQAFAAGAPAGSVPQADPRTQGYAAWYAAGLHQVKLDADHGHRFAYGALLAQERGLDQQTAAQAGMASAGLARASASRGWWADPAIRSVLLGVISLGALLFLPFYFVILPIFGILSALRSLNSPRLPIAVIGLALNGAAILITVAGFLGVRLF